MIRRSIFQTCWALYAWKMHSPYSSWNCFLGSNNKYVWTVSTETSLMTYVLSNISNVVNVTSNCILPLCRQSNLNTVQSLSTWTFHRCSQHAQKYFPKEFPVAGLFSSTWEPICLKSIRVCVLWRATSKRPTNYFWSGRNRSAPSEADKMGHMLSFLRTSALGSDLDF